MSRHWHLNLRCRLRPFVPFFSPTHNFKTLSDAALFLFPALKAFYPVPHSLSSLLLSSLMRVCGCSRYIWFVCKWWESSVQKVSSSPSEATDLLLPSPFVLLTYCSSSSSSGGNWNSLSLSLSLYWATSMLSWLIFLKTPFTSAANSEAVIFITV